MRNSGKFSSEITHPGRMTATMSAVQSRGETHSAIAARVVRVALCRHGRILDERMVHAGAHLVIGSGARSAFLIDAPEIGEHFELIRSEKERFILCVPECAEARLLMG
ncbi:MAG: hypothetical protein U0165_10280, partial [Polyangiaceae bacterium]